MSLLEIWSAHFQSSVRSRGRSYQMAGKVTLLDPTDDELIKASVEGDESHTVTIRGDGETASAHCTCGYFAAGSYCKHIWAAVLDAHSKGTTSSDGAIGQTSPAAPKARKRSKLRRSVNKEPEWVGRLSLLRSVSVTQPIMPAAPPLARQMSYVINMERSGINAGLVVETWQRQAIASGWSRAKPIKIDPDTIGRLDDPIDREICGMLLGAQRFRLDDMDQIPTGDRPQGMFSLRPGLRLIMLKKMVETGRCAHDGQDISAPLSWEDEPWVLFAACQREGQDLTLSLQLRRDDAILGIDEPLLVVGGDDGIVVCHNTASPFHDHGATRWVTQFRDDRHDQGDSKPIRVGATDIDRFLERLYQLPQLPELDLPPGIGRTVRHIEPTPHLDLLRQRDAASRHLIAKISFDYAGHRIRPEDNERLIPVTTPGGDELARRDPPFEHDAVGMLANLGFRRNPVADEHSMVLPVRHLASAVSALIARGWKISADQRVLRNAAAPRLSIVSGIDWFELRGGVSFDTDHGPQTIGLPEILAAAQAGQHMITLDDGSHGMMPLEWLQQHQMLSGVAVVDGDHLRFKATQASLLDALLEEQVLVEVDEPFAQARERLRQFTKIEPIQENETFCGQLRNYQRDALGWFEFLRWFGTGGILADDMGLGKTVQVLAMLDHRLHDQNAPRKPTLIVVPRSVVFNWIDEAQKFAPDLRVLAYAGSDRRAIFDDHDVIITSYGLMRRDIMELRKHSFDYIVLDEAQAIKNASSQSAKAARLLNSDHRLALTGTPVENHLGDIWSIFEFLNPGMLGSAGRFGDIVQSGVQDPHSQDAANQCARAMRIFILRRTKSQVLTELPEKTEQTIVCEMEPAQRLIYDELLQHYRGTLLSKISTPRIGQSAMMVLEALLRLRQAACHPALIDAAKQDQPSAKLDVLVDQLLELIDEGHKALVFSQFTSFLALVRKRLDDADIAYEYLDGQTRDRKAPVQRFQEDEACPVFLISLKAGGLGLNLTAAEYVFILDPWWNPAVEAQAIDRAHRIGQTRHVFAYRLICKDSVEQRIIELQDKKRKLADAIIGGHGGLLKNLTRKDLQQLLS